MVPVFVAVGYRGRRLRSLDLGQTWVDEEVSSTGQDDQNVLRAVAYGGPAGKGLFVAVGYRIFSSPDGAHWTEQDNPNRAQWLGGVRYGNERWVATGGYGYSAFSTDGASWSVGGALETEASRSLAFGSSTFVSASSSGSWWQSENGQTWSRHSAGHPRTDDTNVAFCDGEFKEPRNCRTPFVARGVAYGEGISVRANWEKLERSDDGNEWSVVHTVDSSNGLEDVAFGYAPK